MSSIEFADGKPLTEDEIRQAASAELSTSLAWSEDELEQNWEYAYRYYKGEYPPKVEAHTSTAISTDVSDTIEWMLPAVLKPLIESPDVVRFDPVNPEDQAQADLESDYVHHTLMKKCNGFLKLYIHIKDALLLKNAVFATYWDKGVRHQKEEYKNLTEIDLADLLSPADGSETKVMSQEVREEPLLDPMTGLPAPPDPETGIPPTQSFYNVTVRRFWKQGRPVVENCKPEAFRVSLSHDSLDLEDVRWCAYLMRKTRAQLLADGYTADQIDEIPPADASRYDNSVRDAREDVERDGIEGGNQTGDPSQDEFDIARVYVMLDADGDGYEERYLVILGGSQGEVLLDYYEVPENPFSASTPFIAAHKFYGYSLFDKVRRLADHKTKVLRMLEDNLDLASNPRKKVLRGMANLDDLMLNQVGGLWRMDDMNAVQEIQPVPIAQQAQQLLDYYDKMRSERTGIDPNAQSIAKIMPEESMNHAMERVISMKEELVGLVIRVFAETGVKSMMLKLRNLLLRYNPTEELVQLRNKWTTINPGNWIERTNTTVKVGLGTGDRIKKINGLNTVFQMQQQAVQGGLQGILVSPERMNYTAAELVRVMGLGDPDDFWLDPSILADQRNANTPRGQEMVRAMQLQQQQAQQAAAEKQAQAQAQAEQQQQIAQLTLKVEEMRQQAKIAEAQIKAQSNDQDRVADLLQGEQDRMAEMQRFMEEQRLAWAQLRATETAGEDKLALEVARTQIDLNKPEKGEGRDEMEDSE